MDEIVVKKSGQGNLKARKIVYYVLGVLEVLLAFRFFLKLLGANDGGTFVSFIYTISGFFIAPFNAIFSSVATNGNILEPATIIAMIVYALIAYGIVMLIKIYKAPKDEVIRRV